MCMLAKLLLIFLNIKSIVEAKTNLGVHDKVQEHSFSVSINQSNQIHNGP